VNDDTVGFSKSLAGQNVPAVLGPVGPGLKFGLRYDPGDFMHDHDRDLDILISRYSPVTNLTKSLSRIKTHLSVIGLG
jgi:hypothetical protein